MKRLSSILLSSALLFLVPSAFAQPLGSPSTSHDEVTLAELIEQLNALLVRLNAYLATLDNTTTTDTRTTATRVPSPVVTQLEVDPPSYAPTISGNRASGTLDIYSYGLWNTPASTSSGVDTLRIDFLSQHNEFNTNYYARNFNVDEDRYVDVTYYSEDGFRGFYRHSNGNTGTITSDVQLNLELGSYRGAQVSGLQIGINNPIVIEGQNLGSIDGLAEYGFQSTFTLDGGFRDSSTYNVFDSVFYSKGNVQGAFSDQITPEGNPEKVAGEVKVWWTDKSWYAENRDENSLVGVFVADYFDTIIRNRDDDYYRDRDDDYYRDRDDDDYDD